MASIGAAGCLFLLAAFMCWFPPATWSQIPFLDDWPPRFQTTVDGVRLLRHAAFSGWRWEFLRGYPIAADVPQSLTPWAALPILVFGSEVGFHVAHLLLVAAVPLLVWWDVRLDREGPSTAPGTGHRDFRLLAAGLAAVCTVSYASTSIRSGDTNALAGAVAVLATLAAAHAVRSNPSTELTALPHASALVLVAALTLTSFSHPGFFLYALLLLAVDAAVARDWRSLQRALVATAAALVAGLPVTWDLWRLSAPFDVLRSAHRPDVIVVALALLAVTAFAAWRARGRARVYALVLVALPAPFVQASFAPVPHVRSVRDVDPALVDRLSGLDGDLVLVESSLNPPFPAHFEALLPAATGKRLYGGMWGGGRGLTEVGTDELDRELRRWGVRHVFVWSESARRYLRASPLFNLLEDNGRWRHYEYVRPPLDPGPGRLVRYGPLGGVIRVRGAQRGEIVTVRTNYDRAWRARLQGQAVPVFDAEGQLAFAAPRDGDYDVELVYPRRLWLIPSAVAALILGALIITLK
jgi:hypothetical protein